MGLRFCDSQSVVVDLGFRDLPKGGFRIWGIFYVFGGLGSRGLGFRVLRVLPQGAFGVQVVLCGFGFLGCFGNLGLGCLECARGLGVLWFTPWRFRVLQV